MSVITMDPELSKETSESGVKDVEYDDTVRKDMQSRALDGYFDGFEEAIPKRCWQWHSVGRRAPGAKNSAD
ncbi:hypothetical protein Pmar_PMAR016409 [Perkinsus marinus ATCC 50983]|uniref:Uncharacterized protein n=1 Tax=Perkinsus marinus (strain ATCC 50983 / TXsc) TaxID=423536 RepID=C5L171_PERM5|nr:hypothetical protein Pmar_PMAR016409 [Perkinsus marinus ATCC 50983]EER09478.1 hypothetical protein Pmar_PMAR016409 [Perkinsus marinus ATCC 50983]|eukprot:XP_002777662.1 hypothetical protein Pmar_PMAR016409 [Perkinsus marinus ATCC 50983]